MQQWRYTRNGMPVTYFLAKAWHPEHVPHEERIRYVACQTEDDMSLCAPLMATECLRWPPSTGTSLTKWSITFVACRYVAEGGACSARASCLT
jgi:hypothetical protein